MADLSRERPIIDPARAVCLCGVGARGYLAAVCVDSDGRDTFWLVSATELAAELPRCGNANQPHEQLGPLPALVRAKIAAIGAPPAAYWYEDGGQWFPVYLCSRPTKKKRACQIPVDQAGSACQFHRDKQAVER